KRRRCWICRFWSFAANTRTQGDNCRTSGISRLRRAREIASCRKVADHKALYPELTLAVRKSSEGKQIQHSIGCNAQPMNLRHLGKIQHDRLELIRKMMQRL